MAQTGSRHVAPPTGLATGVIGWCTINMSLLRSWLPRPNYSLRTERSYGDWVRRYVQFHRMRSREELRNFCPRRPRLKNILSDLAANDRVTVSTQNQAFKVC